MTIAINLLWLLRKEGSGSFVYIQNLLDGFLKIDKQNKYYLLVNWYNYWRLKERYKKNSNVEIKVIDIRRDFIFNPIRAILKLIAKINGEDAIKEEVIRKEIQLFIDKKNIDILFFPSTMIYPRNLRNVKIIIVIYDLQHEYFPYNFSETELAQRKKDYQYTVNNSNHVIAISEYTKKTIIEKYNTDSNKISVTYLGVGTNKCKKSDLSLPSDFIFYPATIWRHKNHLMLIRALKELEPDFPGLNLIFTGAIKDAGLKKEIDNSISLYGLSNKVKHLGYVSDADLVCIYQKAKIMVFPSAFEGFGLPIIEAFKYGVPVVAADNTSIREIVGETGLLFENDNLRALVECVKRIIQNQNLKEKLIKNGLQKAGTFTWEDTARKTLIVFNKTMANGD